MQITTEIFGNVLVAHTPDELTEDNTPAFKDALEKQLQNRGANLVLQMDRSDHFDSTGLSFLLEMQESLRSQGGNIVISGLTDVGRKILEMTRLDQRFDTYDSVIDAVSSYR